MGLTGILAGNVTLLTAHPIVVFEHRNFISTRFSGKDSRLGECHSRRLVLEAWERLEREGS